MLGYGIPGIGLGNYGLSPDGCYASYDLCMPNMMAMNPMMYNSSIFGANPSLGMSGLTANELGMYGGYGMYGMYNPAFMANMQNQIEEMQINHAGRMHEKIAEHSVNNYRQTNTALINRTLTDASIQQGVMNLRAKVIEGDQDGICREFDNLRNQVMYTYKDEIAARGSKENPKIAASQIVELLYSNIVSANQGGVPADLRSDIVKYGDGALANGFMKGFRKDHHDKFVDETMNHCFGLSIDHKQSKEIRQVVGKAGGTTASVLEKGAIGTVAGAGLYSLALGGVQLFARIFGKAKPDGKYGPKFKWSHMGKAGAIAAVLMVLADIGWKIFDSNKAAA